MPARVVSSPTAVTRTRIAESVDTVPATTREPVVLATGRDSPVIIDSSSSAAPSTITPSAGTRPPGRTSTTSPSRRSPAEMRWISSPWTISASSGSRAANAASAPWAWPMAFISCQWPSNMMVTSAASSHQNSRSTHPSVEAIEAPHATVIAIAISSIIPGARSRTSTTAPAKRLAAVEEDERPQDRPDPGDVRQLVAEPPHHHLGGHDDRDGQGQAQPELVAERLRVVTGVLVVAGVRVVPGVLVVAGVRVVPGVLVVALAAIGASAVTSVVGHGGLLVGRVGRIGGLVFHGTLLGLTR